MLMFLYPAASEEWRKVRMNKTGKPLVMVVDAQGGGLGKQLISNIKREIDGVCLIAIGTNTVATASMLKAGADEAATGENAVLVVSRKADFIIGPIGMVIADAMLGEITPAMASAIAGSNAMRIMIPFSNCDNYIAGVSDFSTSRLIQDAVTCLKKALSNEA